MMENGHGVFERHGVDGVFRGYSGEEYHMLQGADGSIDASWGGIDVMIAGYCGTSSCRFS